MEPPYLPYTPFALITARLIILPTPSAVDHPAYRSMYANLHSLPSFAYVAFGPDFKLWNKTDAEMLEHLHAKIASTWTATGLGDCAVGILASPPTITGTSLSDSLTLVSGTEFEESFTAESKVWDGVQWVGYVGLRDCRPNLPPREPGDEPLNDWREMVELRYGYAPEAWGKGYGTECAMGLMRWGEERGIRRYVADTEKANLASGRVLGKIGFVRQERAEWWKDESLWEWERWVECL